MTDNDEYTERFYELFLNMQRQGPGDISLNLEILSLIDNQQQIKHVLDIGSGTGTGTEFLAGHLDAQVTALDNAETFLDKLCERIEAQGLDHRVSVVNGSMLSPPFAETTFDLIWSEGSAYIMGFEKALKRWKPLLTEQGYLYISELCWFTDTPDETAACFWEDGYPDMTNVSTREQQIKAAGYKIIASKPLPQSAWNHFHLDMQNQLAILKKSNGDHRAYKDCATEIKLFEQCKGQFGYQCFLLRK